METIENWISINSTLVYFLLFTYCFVKSGAVPLFAGIMVSANALSAPSVVIAVFLGGYLGDELRFYLGRRYAETIQEKWPKTIKLIQISKRLMEKYGAWYVFIYRYPKGMRTIGAFPVGMSRMAYPKFLFLNIGSTTVWTVLLVGGGALLGNSIKQVGEQYYGLMSIILLLIFSICIYILSKKLDTNM